jgi:excisionase family DNA binding protein
MPETKATPTLLTAREVQARLRLGRNSVYELAKKREITTVKIGSKVLFPEAEVEAFVRRNTVPAKRNFFGTRGLSQRERSFGSSALHTSQDKGVAGVGQ